MNAKGIKPLHGSLESYGIKNAEAHWNLSSEDLANISVEKGMATKASTGALAVNTGKFTGRSPEDRFIVKDHLTEDSVWWGKINKPFDSEAFDKLYDKVANYLSDKKLYVRDVYACSDERYQVPLRVVNEYPWSNMFIYNMFLRAEVEELENFDALEAKLILTNPKTLEVKRNDTVVSLPIPNNLATSIAKFKKTAPFVIPRIPVVVDSVGKTSVVTSGNFQKGDTLLAMNGNSIKYQYEFLEVKNKYADSLVIVQLKRGADTLAVKTLINGSGQIGLFVKLPYALFTTVHKEFGFIDAFPEGVRRCFTTLDNYVQGIKQIFTGKVNPNDSLGSLISIGNTFPSSWDWERFWTLTAIFSIILAFMNVLPIPALDGGHALFILFEMITGRKPSDKFMEYAQIVGMVLMFGLMFYALGLDFWRLFK